MYDPDVRQHRGHRSGARRARARRRADHDAWGSYPGEDAYTTGSATALYDVLGVTYTPTEDGVTVGTYGYDAMWYAVTRVGPDERLASYVLFDPHDLTDGAVIAIDGHAATGGVLRRAADTGDRFGFAGYLAGDLSFEAADDTDGAAVRGTQLVGDEFGEQDGEGVFGAAMVGAGGDESLGEGMCTFEVGVHENNVTACFLASPDALGGAPGGR